MTSIKDYLGLFKKYRRQLMYFQVSIPLPLIYDFVNTLDRDDTLARLKKFRKWDVSKRLVNGPCFQQMIVDREFEPGSFGEAFKIWSNKASNKAVDLFKVSLEVKHRSKNPSKLFEAFQRHSMMQHDLIHFFNDYDTSTIGELCVLSYHLGNEWKKSWVFFIMIGAWASLKYTLIPGKTTKRMSWKDLIMHLPVVDYYRWMREAYKRGKNSVDFIFVDWESLFNKPLEDVKKEIGITGPPEYWQQSRRVRRAWTYEAKKTAV